MPLSQLVFFHAIATLRHKVKVFSLYIFAKTVLPSYIR